LEALLVSRYSCKFQIGLFLYRGCTIATSFISGTTGYVQVGSLSSQRYGYKAWKLAMSCNLPKVNNFLDAPYQRCVDGVRSAKVSCNGPYDQTTGMGALVAGTSYQFVLGFSASISFTVTARVSALNLSNDVDDAPRVDGVEAESDGSFSASIT
jgi:hypothetical protein